jgi:hypothetical protein
LYVIFLFKKISGEKLMRSILTIFNLKLSGFQISLGDCFRKKTPASASNFKLLLIIVTAPIKHIGKNFLMLPKIIS